MAKHLPSFQFYPADWLKDPKLQLCKRATKGMWIDIICYLHESDTRGKISATAEEWCRLIGCTLEDFNDFLSENKSKKFANISESNGVVTVKNRRMCRDEKARQQTRERVKQFRGNGVVTEKKRKCNAHPSSSTSSSGTKVPKYIVHNRLFKHWNGLGIISHRVIDKFLPALNSRLEKYTETELQEAMDNYGIVLAGAEFFWSYRWGLDDFLKPDNLDKFLSANDPFTNFKKAGELNGKTSADTGDKYAGVYE